MVAGHFGFAAMVKARERTSPLWALMLATVWLDILFIPLLLLHRESVQPVHAGYAGMIIHADYTHSLAGILLLSALLGAVFWRKLGTRVALVVALVSSSHWLLDLIVHRPDMPLLPGNLGHLPYVGFGLWNYPRATGCVELLLVVAGAAMYGRAAEEVSIGAGKSRKLAFLSAGMIAAFGLIVLWLDYSS